MPSPEHRARPSTIVAPWLSRYALLAVLWMLGLAALGSRSSDAQSPPPQSERETERQRLLDQLGLKKSPPKSPANGDAKPEEDEKRANESEKDSHSPGAGERPPGDEGTTQARPEAPPALVFVGAVHRTLLGACQSCHGAGGVAGRSAFLLDGTWEADFGATRRQVNAAEPERSPLLRQASGQGHAGGVILAPASAGHQLLLRWIGAGARRGAVAAAASPAPAAVIPALGPLAAAAPPGAATPPPAVAPVTTAPAPETLGVARRVAYAPALHDALNQACSGCHRSGAVATNTGYVLTGDVAADFASARRFVDLEQPERSTLLRKASGEAHAGGVVYAHHSAAHGLLLEWIALGAWGPTDALSPTPAETTPTAPPAPAASAPTQAAPLGVAGAGSSPAPDGSGASAHGRGLSLPFNFRLNGRFDLNYERRNFDTQPFSAGDDAIQSYHHFIFLSRRAQGDAVGFTAEIVNLTFWEVDYHSILPQSSGQLWIKAGKLLVPFGPDPLFHQSYGGLAGFDQRVLPTIWAQEGLSARYLLERGDLSGSADLYAVRGHELGQRDTVLNLQSNLSPVDSARVAIGARLRASWKAVSLFYSGYANGLGFGRLLYLQAADVAVWRLRGVPVLERMAGELGLLRADVSGAGPGQDYYHFASYLRLRYYLTDLAYIQYRQGLRTFDNRRGVILDDTRLTREDGSTHNFGLVSRHGPLTFGLYYYFNLEKADEVRDDFLRITGVYEF
jgi:hypothetical protein